jgi:hypothetical protein
MVTRCRFLVSLSGSCLAAVVLGACGGEEEALDLDSLVGGGRVGGVSGAYGGVTSNPVDAGSPSGDGGILDGSSDASGDADLPGDATIRSRLLRVMERVVSTCQNNCDEYVACDVVLPESECVRGCQNLTARVDRSTPDTDAAVSCANTIEDLWVCVAGTFSCEDYFYAREGRFSRCDSPAVQVTFACGDFGLTGLSVIDI